jgi:hypothetical protein
MTQPKHRPERTQLIIHAGTAEARAIVPEWWGAIDSDFESRRLRFAGDGRQWLDEGILPPSLIAAGCYFADVVSTDGQPGLVHRRLVAGARVLLQPESTPQGSAAIAVWLDGAPIKVGYLPADVAAGAIEAARRHGTGFGAVVASEARDAKTHERRGVTVILGPVALWADKAA